MFDRTNMEDRNNMKNRTNEEHRTNVELDTRGKGHTYIVDRKNTWDMSQWEQDKCVG